jgi:hypothetical protein
LTQKNWTLILPQCQRHDIESENYLKSKKRSFPAPAFTVRK